MKKRLLIMNGSWGELPAIRAAHELGFHVITSGNKPDAYGHQFADEYICGDYSNPEDMVRVAKEAKADAVCGCANDLGAIAACYVAEKMGLPGHDSFETFLTLHHKDKFKRFARQYGIMTPLAESFTDSNAAKAWASEKAIYPMIVKPVDMFSGIGIHRADNYKEISAAIDAAFSAGKRATIVIEPFITGTSHTFTVFLVNQKVVAYYSDDEYTPPESYRIILSAAPATGIEFVRDTLMEQANKIAGLLHLVDGVMHIQYIMDADHKPHILEISRRVCGGHHPDRLECAIGVPLAKWIVMAESGMDCKHLRSDSIQKGFTSNYVLMPPKNGTVRDIRINEELKGHIFRSCIWGVNGYEVTDHARDTVATFTFHFDTREDMMDKLSRLPELIEFDYE